MVAKPRSGVAGRKSAPLLYLAVLASLAIVNFTQFELCHAKEFDWDDLSAALTSKGHLQTASGTSMANNLRILVSPQRRMTKGYEFDYANSSSVLPVASGEPTYVLPSSSGAVSGSPYAQQTPSGQSQTHSAAYTALSASLASLKSRLGSRNAAISTDNGQSGAPYASAANPYEQSSSAGAGSYLGGSQVDHSGASQVTNDNKTIVLAIPAKINFLTTNSKGQPQQQQQQVTMMHTTDAQQQHGSNPKQIRLISSSELEQSSAPGDHQQGQQQQQHQQQYVVLSNPGQPGEQTHQGGQMSSQYQSSAASIYSAALQPGLTVKYVPVSSQSLEVGSQQLQQQEPGQALRGYFTCPDTCNSADPRWRKHSVAKYKACCSRSAGQTEVEHPSSDKVGDAADAYYSYLNRKSRSRRSRKLSKVSGSARHSTRYSSASDDDGYAQDNGSQAVVKQYSKRPYAGVYNQDVSTGVDSQAVKSYRRNRARDFDASQDSAASQVGGHGGSDGAMSSAEEEGSHPDSVRMAGQHGYAGSQYVSSVSGSASDDEEVSGSQLASASPEGAEGAELGAKQLQAASDEYQAEPAPYGEPQEPSELDSGLEPVRSQAVRRRKSVKRANRKGSASQRSKRQRKVFKSTNYSSSNNITSDYDSTQPGDGYYSQPSDASNAPVTSSDDSTVDHGQQGAAEQNPQQEPQQQDLGQMLSARYRAALNESAVASLSKTTMHLKEILNILEKKTHLKPSGSANEPSPTSNNNTQSSSGSSSSSSTSTSTSTTTTTTTTTTPAPPTTMPSYNPLSSFLSNLPTEFLTSDLTLKSPYRFDASSLTSTLGSPSYSSLSSYGSLSPETLSSFASLSSSPYSPFSGKSLVGLPPSVYSPKRRRVVNKNGVRYSSTGIHQYNPSSSGSHNSNHLMNVPQSMRPTPPHAPGSSPVSLATSSTKNPYLKSSLYSTLPYPYWYSRVNPASVFTSYPYKNLSKGPYSSLIGNSPLSSKLMAAASGYYSDDTRYSGLANYDTLSSVASSLRPTSTMRLRTKPFIFQPQVLPIYSRHSILRQPLDTKK